MSTASNTLRALFKQIPVKSLSTKRAVDKDCIRTAIREARNAKSRVRVYSKDGFVPNSYKYGCQIQYVEVRKIEGDQLAVSLGWCNAQRRGGSASLVVVQ